MLAFRLNSTVYPNLILRSRDSRTSIDWAEEIRQLLEVDYPQFKIF